MEVKLWFKSPLIIVTKIYKLNRRFVHNSLFCKRYHEIFSMLQRILEKQNIMEDNILGMVTLTRTHPVREIWKDIGPRIWQILAQSSKQKFQRNAHSDYLKWATFYLCRITMICHSLRYNTKLVSAEGPYIYSTYHECEQSDWLFHGF